MNNGSTLCSDADSHLHISDPSCKPQHDSETFRSSYGKLTNTIGSDHCNLKAVTINTVPDDTVRSVEKPVHHQLPSALFSANTFSVSSMSGGAVFDAYPIPATALTPLSAFNHSQTLSNHTDITATAVGVSKQPEKPILSMSSHTMSFDRGHLLALTPTRIQAGAKLGGNTCNRQEQKLSASQSKPFDVYEFCDEDDSELTSLGTSFRGGRLSASATSTNSVRSLPSSRISHPPSAYRRPSIYDSTKKYHSSSETDAGMISARQNVAVIFDMDSKSIRHVSLPVKTEPVILHALTADSVPSTQVNSTSVHVTQPTSYTSAGQRKHHLLTNDTSCKRIRLNNNSSSYQGFENIKMETNLPNIHDLIPDVRQASKCDDSMMAFGNWSQKSSWSQPVNFTERSSSSAFRSVAHLGHKPSSYPLINPVEVSAQNHVVNRSCGGVGKCEYDEHASSVPTCQFSVARQSATSACTWPFSGSAACPNSNTYSIRAIVPVPLSDQSMCPTYAGSEYCRYRIHQPNSMSVSEQAGSYWKEKNKYESSMNWWHMATTNHSGADQSQHVGQNTFRSTSFEVAKTDRVNPQHDALAHVLDLRCKHSQMSPSASHVTHTLSFHPNLPPAASSSRYGASQVQQTISDNPSPHLHLGHHSYYQPQQQKQQQQQQQLDMNVKKEDLKEMRMELTDEENLMNRLKCNLIEEVPHCQCKGLLFAIYKL